MLEIAGGIILAKVLWTAGVGLVALVLAGVGCVMGGR